MAQAAREGAEFKLVIDADKTTQELGFTIEWYGGPRDLETETYAPGRAAAERDSLANEHTFDGEWFTLTPAASFIIGHAESAISRLSSRYRASGTLTLRKL